MLRFICDQIATMATAFGAKRLIRLRENPDSEPYDYLNRYYVLRTPLGSIFLHQFLGPDVKRLHDHPWDWCSIMLLGGYCERLADTRVRFVNPGQVTFRQAEIFHAVEAVEPDGGTWTLFIHGPRRRTWGDMVGGVWNAVGNRYGNRLKGGRWGLFPAWEKGKPGEHDD